MHESDLPQPTEGEHAILRVLWELGPCTVREVHEVLRAERQTGYTTTLKLMQIMAEKGLVTRDTSVHRHIYEAAITEDRAQRRLVRELLDRAFDGSSRKLIMQALATSKASPEEIESIRTLLKEYKEGNQ